MVSEFVPFSGAEDLTLLAVRIILGAVMVYHGTSKIKDLKANAKFFDKIGFKPGAFWGFIVMMVEFFGGILVMFGVYAGIFAALFGFQMITGIIWKTTKTDKPFTEWSYDLALLALSLVIITFGPGKYSLSSVLSNLLV